MSEKNKTNKELIGELAELRAKLKKSEKTIDLQQLIQDELKDSEERYRNILKSIEDGYYEVDIEGNYTFFNDSMAKMLGYPKKELIGMNNRKYMSDDTAKEVYKTFNKVYRTKIPTKAFDWELIRKDGRKVFVETSVTPIMDSSKKVIGFRGIARNITERKKTEEALRHSESKYRDLIENATDIIFMLGIEGNILEVNETILRESGYSSEEILSMNFKDFVHPDDMSIALEAYERGRAGDFREFEMRVMKRGGNFEWFSFIIRPIFDSKGSAISAHGIGRNITEKKRADEEILYLKQFNENIINHMVDPIDIVDKGFNIVFQNRTSIKKFGNGTGKKCYEFYHGSKNPCDYCTAISSIKEEKTFKREVQIEDGTYLEVYSSPLLMPDGSYCSLEIIRDITERKKAEEALRESEEKYRALSENIPDIVYSLDEAGKVTYINKEGLRLGEYSLFEIVGRPFVELIHPEDRDMVLKSFMEAIEEKRTSTSGLKFRVCGKDGAVYWGELNSHMHFDKNGNYIREEGVLRDITDRIKMEEALRESEKRHRDLVENIEDIIYVFDGNGDLKFFNKATEKFSGYSKEELQNVNLRDLFTPDSYKIIEEKFKRQLAGEDFGTFEHEFINKKGEIRYIEARERLVWEGDRVVEVHGIGRDITERKKAEEAIRDSERKYRLLVENLNAGIWYIDKGANTTYVNPRMAEMLGYESDEMIDRNLFDFMDDKWKKITKDYLKRRKSGVREQHYFEFIKKDGSRLYASVETAPIIDSNGEYIGALAGIQDITDRKRAEDSLKESEEKYRTLFENAKEAILVLQDGVIKFFNPRALEISGFSGEEFLMRTFKDLIYPDDLERVMERHQRILDGEDLLEPNIYRVIRKDGSSRWVEGTGVSIQWEGRPASLSFFSDITEKKKAEEALRESEERYRTLVQASNDGIAVVQEGKVVFISPIFTEQSEYSEEEILGESFDKFIHPEDLTVVTDNYLKRLSGERVPQTYEFRVVDKSGRQTPVEANAVMIEWYGKPAILSITRDITERKQAEEKIREVNERMEATLNALPDILFEVDRHGRIYDFRTNNPEFLYTTPQEFLGRMVNEILPEEASNLIMDAINQAVEKGQHTGAIYPLETPMGSGLFELSIAAKGDPKTEDGRLICLVRDITERKKTEEALRESEEKYRMVVENAKEAILVFQDGIIKFFNPRALEITGFSEEEFLLKPFLDLLHPDDLQRAVERHQRILDGKDLTEPSVYRIFRKDGSLVWIEGTGIAIQWKGRSASLSFFSDVTEKKKAEDALIESEKKLRNLFETSQDVIFFSTADGKIVDINPQGEILFGYAIDEFEKLDLEIFYQDPQDLVDLLKVIREKGSVKDYELLLKKKDGSLIDCLLTATMWKDDKGKILGYQGIIRDVTEKKKFEKQLVQAQKMEAIGSLAGGIAHNFNNILVGIMGYSEYLISKKEEDDPDYKALKTIHEATIRASELTRQLLNVARREEHKRSIVSLNDVVKKGLPLVAGTFDKSIEIKTYLPGDLLMIEGDVGQLEQCFLNICINARDVMPKGGSLIVETFNQRLDKNFVNTHLGAAEGDYVVLSITDTGKGISPEIREHIFEPFFTTKEDKGGTGMGLSTVYGIVKNHGGFISVYSEEGEGSTFKLYFPTVKGKMDVVKPVVERMGFGGNETILIVDDEPIVKDMWSEYLTDMGYRVILAGDGQEGVEIFSRRRDEIDLVILDLVMPRLGGKEAFFKLKEIDPDVLVIFTSGYSENGQAYEILELDAEGFIQKPFPLMEFAKKIRETLDKKKN